MSERIIVFNKTEGTYIFGGSTTDIVSFICKVSIGVTFAGANFATENKKIFRFYQTLHVILKAGGISESIRHIEKRILLLDTTVINFPNLKDKMKFKSVLPIVLSFLNKRMCD